jgi:hypothetical protein
VAFNTGSKVDPWDWRSRTICEAENGYGKIPRACLDVVSLEVEDEFSLNIEEPEKLTLRCSSANVVKAPNDVTGPTKHEHDV